jgi:hypothetical protein
MEDWLGLLLLLVPLLVLLLGQYRRKRSRRQQQEEDQGGQLLLLLQNPFPSFWPEQQAHRTKSHRQLVALLVALLQSLELKLAQQRFQTRNH